MRLKEQINDTQLDFGICLRKISVISFILKFIYIPIDLLIAEVVSIIVDYATSGKTNNVLKLVVFLVFVLTLTKIFQIVTNIAYEKSKSKVLHECKINLYKKFLSNPLNILYSSEYGKSMEKLNDDFNNVTGKSVLLYPNFLIGILTIVIYSVFIAFKNIWVAIILLVVSSLQIFPPIIVKKYMKINYDNCRDIESAITDFTIEGYRGIATIKLYHLKQWWLNKFADLHKKYIKIGNAGIYTTTAESTLNELVSMLLKYGTYAIFGLLILFEITTLEIGVQAISLSGGLFAAVKTVFSSIPNFAVEKVAEKRLSQWFFERNQTAVPSNNAQIDLVNVTQFFAEKEILKVTISFASHRVCVIKGSNGIGKSTVFKLIVGLLPCEYGSLTVGNVNPTNFCDCVFPKTLFYLPQEDVAFDFTPYILCKMIDGELLPAFLEVSKRFNLTDKQINETKISDLSGGERKKVFLALAFAINPKILLLDEPTNSLDEAGKMTLVSLLQRRDNGTLIITHDQLFDSIADCFYRISNGGIIDETKA